MASTTRGAELTEAHRVAQIRLGARIESQVAALWDQLVDIRRVNESVNQWILRVIPLIMGTSNVSAQLAVTYLTEFFTAETTTAVTPAFTPAAAPAPRLIGATLDKTAREAVWTAAKYRDLPEALQVVQATSARSAQELTLRSGRETITTAPNPLDIRQAVGWRRITDFAPCKWCASLAGKESDGFKAAGFKAHPGCGCNAEPFFA